MKIAQKKDYTSKMKERKRLREPAQGQMRDAQTERKEALFIIFVASLFGSSRASENIEGQKEKGSGKVPGGCLCEV